MLKEDTVSHLRLTVCCQFFLINRFLSKKYEVLCSIISLSLQRELNSSRFLDSYKDNKQNKIHVLLVTYIFISIVSMGAFLTFSGNSLNFSLNMLKTMLTFASVCLKCFFCFRYPKSPKIRFCQF